MYQQNKTKKTQQIKALSEAVKFISLFLLTYFYHVNFQPADGK